MGECASDDKIRLDKWLWAARFYKTRTLAKEAIEGGKVHYNGQRTKPGKAVEMGAKVRLRIGWSEREIVIAGLSDERKGAPEAQKLYQETTESVQRREDDAWHRKALQAASLPPARRPNKKERRDIQRLHDLPGDA
ncbi:MAG: ribosome-associated heat shock protein Hsp15 [Gammaproteobacteria bacterium]|nr:ribosome-associated heat shock protein Hsp15 [Gammaproteobacteria bacterium]